MYQTHRSRKSNARESESANIEAIRHLLLASLESFMTEGKIDPGNMLCRRENRAQTSTQNLPQKALRTQNPALDPVAKQRSAVGDRQPMHRLEPHIRAPPEDIAVEIMDDVSHPEVKKGGVRWDTGWSLGRAAR